MFGWHRGEEEMPLVADTSELSSPLLLRDPRTGDQYEGTYRYYYPRKKLVRNTGISGEDLEFLLCSLKSVEWSYLRRADESVHRS